MTIITFRTIIIFSLLLIVVQIPIIYMFAQELRFVKLFYFINLSMTISHCTGEVRKEEWVKKTLTLFKIRDWPVRKPSKRQ